MKYRLENLDYEWGIAWIVAKATRPYLMENPYTIDFTDERVIEAAEAYDKALRLHQKVLLTRRQMGESILAENPYYDYDGNRILVFDLARSISDSKKSTEFVFQVSRRTLVELEELIAKLDPVFREKIVRSSNPQYLTREAVYDCRKQLFMFVFKYLRSAYSKLYNSRAIVNSSFEKSEMYRDHEFFLEELYRENSTSIKYIDSICEYVVNAVVHETVVRSAKKIHKDVVVWTCQHCSVDNVHLKAMVLEDVSLESIGCEIKNGSGFMVCKTCAAPSWLDV